VKTKTRRVKGWCAAWPDGAAGELHQEKQRAWEEQRAWDAERVVRVVEVRKGEVVVDVERLREVLDNWARPREGAGPHWVAAALREAGAVKP
jgi:hypothetical protein